MHFLFCSVLVLCDYPLLQDSNTPLHLACHPGHLEVIELLMSHAADINLRNKVHGCHYHDQQL